MVDNAEQRSVATEKAEMEEPVIPSEKNDKSAIKVAFDASPKQEQPLGSSLVDQKDIKVELQKSGSDIYKYKIEQDLEAQSNKESQLN